MKKGDLYLVLSSFNKEELREFSKFLRSPYFNRQSTLIKLYDRIIKFYPSFDSDELDNEKLFHAVNPHKKYNDVVFRKYISTLTKLAELFLVSDNHRKDKDGEDLVLLEEYYRRRINKRYEKTLKQIEDPKNIKQEIGESYYLNKHMLEEIKINYEIMNEHFPLDINMLYNTQFYMFNYFVMLTLNNLVELMNYVPDKQLLNDKNIVVSFIRNFDFGKFIDDLSGLPEEQLLTIKLNYLNIMIVLHPEEKKHYLEMKQLIRKYSDNLSLNYLYIYLIKINNYCINRLYAGDSTFLAEIFDNYDFAYHNEKYLIKLRQNYSFAEFRNALFFSLEMGKTDWARWMVDTFTDYVRTDKKINLFYYADAFLLFEDKDYEHALAKLSHVEIIQPLMRLDVDLLLTKIYYELNYFEACFSLVDSFTNLIQNSKLVSKNVKQQILNYLKIYKKLLEIKCEQKKYDLNEIIHDIRKEKMLKSSNWLLEKANDLIK